MPIKITVNVKNSDQALAYIKDVRRKLSSPKANRAVTRVATYWAQSYKAEGAKVGGWAQLAESTQRNRDAQGYDPSHPIMYRQGVLYQLGTQFFLNKQRSSSSTRGTRYDRRISTTASLRLSKGGAMLEIKGPKVFNQWPGRANDRPARPFWFVTPPVKQAAKSGVSEWLVKEVF